MHLRRRGGGGRLEEEEEELGDGGGGSRYSGVWGVMARAITSVTVG